MDRSFVHTMETAGPTTRPHPACPNGTHLGLTVASPPGLNGFGDNTLSRRFLPCSLILPDAPSGTNSATPPANRVSFLIDAPGRINLKTSGLNLDVLGRKDDPRSRRGGAATPRNPMPAQGVALGSPMPPLRGSTDGTTPA